MQALAPNNVANNAYRLLGLSCGASQAEIDQAARKMRLWAERPRSPPSPWDPDWLPPLNRNKNAVEDAVNRLYEPTSRVRERLLWFFEKPQPPATTSSLPSDTPILHDVAAGLVQTLIQNRGDDVAQWKILFDAYSTLSRSSAYIDWLVSIEDAGDFEKRATAGEITNSVQQLPLDAAHAFAAGAAKALEINDIRQWGMIIGVLRASGTPAGELNVIEGRVRDQIEQLIDQHCQKLETNMRQYMKGRPNNDAIWSLKSLCRDARKALDETILPLAEHLVSPGNEQSAQAQRVRTACMKLLHLIAQVGFYCGDHISGDQAFEKALILAQGSPGTEARVRQWMSELEKRWPRRPVRRF